MRHAATAAAVLLLSLLATGSALGDGDPASDVLVGQSVFLPYAPVSRDLETRLYVLTEAAASAGYPLRVALIGAPGDLGVVPGLFAKPAAYARFLSTEIAGTVPGPVLVVMPQGFGLAAGGRAESVTGLTGVRIDRGPDGLASAAADAIPILAAGTGHPLPAGTGARPASTGASGATTRDALDAMLAMVVLAGLALAGAAYARARAGVPRRGVDAEDHPR